MHVVRVGSIGGGMEKGIINVANRLPEEFRVSICVLDGYEEFSSRLRRSGAEIHLMPSRQGGVDRTWIPHLARLFRRSGVDVVHSHGWGTFLYAVPAAQLSRRKIVHGEHGKNLHELTEKNPLKVWSRRLLGRATDRIVTVSEPLRQEWIQQYGMNPHHVTYIPNGVDLARFAPVTRTPAEYRRGFGLPEDAFILGTVGRFDPIKNFPMMARTAALLDPSIAIAFLGDGPCRQETESLARSLGISDRVHFVGTRPDVENFLHAIDAFTLPSPSEGMSNVVLEAMAAGLPIVCPAIPAHQLLIDPSEREGILLSPYTEETLAREIAGLRVDSGRRKMLGENAQAKIRRQFTIDLMVERHATLYREAAARRSQ
jgi:glycosyltransferase involved in cell wall biosynthesis